MIGEPQTTVCERKWVLPAIRAEVIRSFLAARLRPDPRHPGGWVVSLYFDTPDWRFLDEKRNSDYLKTKVRLRWYEDDDRRSLGDHAFLEVKGKIGGRREKLRESVALDPDLVSGAPLSEARVRELLVRLRSRGVDLPAPLRPAFTIRYRRQRFLEPVCGARISLDDRIHVPSVNPLQVPSARRPRLDRAVVESKGPGPDPPRSLAALVELGCQRQAFSKYGECHSRLLDPFP